MEQSQQNHPSVGENTRLQMLVMRVSHLLRFGHEGTQEKIPPGQKRALCILGMRGELSQKELLEALGIAPASLSELITKLENKELVIRTRSTEDRRVVVVSLTESGKKLAEELLERDRKIAQEVFGGLDENTRKSLDATLQQIIDSWEE